MRNVPDIVFRVGLRMFWDDECLGPANAKFDLKPPVSRTPLKPTWAIASLSRIKFRRHLGLRRWLQPRHPCGAIALNRFLKLQAIRFRS